MKSKFQLVYRELTRKELGLPTSESMQDAIHSWIELDSIAIWIIYICDRLSILSQYRPNRRQCRVRMGQRRLTITAMHACQGAPWRQKSTEVEDTCHASNWCSDCCRWSKQPLLQSWLFMRNNCSFIWKLNRYAHRPMRVVAYCGYVKRYVSRLVKILNRITSKNNRNC